MLRRAFTASTIATFSSCSFAPAMMMAAARTHIIFSEQSPVLANNAKHLGYKHNVWVESKDDEYWYKELSKPKKDETPTEVRVDRELEYFNISQFRECEDVEARLPKVNGPASFKTKHEFRGALARELARVSQTDKYCTSKWWVSRRDAGSRGLTLRSPRARPTEVVINVTTSVYSADQFEEPEKIAVAPISGRRLVPFGKDFRPLLTKAIADNGWTSGLFFSSRQLQLFGLELVDGAKPTELPQSGMRKREMEKRNSNKQQFLRNMTIYNTDQLVGPEQVLKSLNRYPVEEDCYLISGKPLGPQMVERIRKAGVSFTSKYWLSEVDRSVRKLEVKEGEKPFAPEGSAEEAATTLPEKEQYFNVCQVKDQAKAFKLAGTSVFLKQQRKKQQSN